MTPEQYCKNKAVKSGSSFYYSFLFLSHVQRSAITALYAFCREVDDVVDEIKDLGVARISLNWWREEVDRLFASQPTHPVTKALLPYLQIYKISYFSLNEIMNGMEMDLEQNRYLDFEGLTLYCYRVAGIVGRLAASIFGGCLQLESTLKYAEHLGLAFQLTNIIRDVGEDARRGRIYIPLSDLKSFEISPQEILQVNLQKKENFLALMKFQTERAREYYRQAFSFLELSEFRQQVPGLVMARIYSKLLSEIEKDGFRVLTHRTSLPPLRKFFLAVGTWLRGKPPQI